MAVLHFLACRRTNEILDARWPRDLFVVTAVLIGSLSECLAGVLQANPRQRLFFPRRRFSDGTFLSLAWAAYLSLQSPTGTFLSYHPLAGAFLGQSPLSGAFCHVNSDCILSDICEIIGRRLYCHLLLILYQRDVRWAAAYSQIRRQLSMELFWSWILARPFLILIHYYILMIWLGFSYIERGTFLFFIWNVWRAFYKRLDCTLAAKLFLDFLACIPTHAVKHFAFLVDHQTGSFGVDFVGHAILEWDRLSIELRLSIVLLYIKIAKGRLR